MVRNADSVQSLRDSIGDMSMAAQPNTRTTEQHEQHAPSSPHQTLANGEQQPELVNLRRTTPLYGSNDYTKVLMNRVATGEATPEERALWEQHVARVKSKPRSSGDNKNNTFLPFPFHPPMSAAATSPMKSHAAQDYSLSLMLQEQQRKKIQKIQKAGLAVNETAKMVVDEKQEARGLHQPLRTIQTQTEPLTPQQKKRLVLARQMRETRAQATDKTEMHPQVDFSTQSSHFPTPGGTTVLDDYHMQLMLLEQQNKKRTLLAAAGGPAKSLEQQQAQATVTSDTQDVMDTFDFDTFLNGSEHDQDPWGTSHNVVKARPNKIAEGWQRAAAQTDNGEAQRFKQATRKNAAEYTEPFCRFLTDNPTVFHAVHSIKKDLKDAGFTALSERDGWDIKPSGSYFVERNGSSLIAFTVGAKYKSGNGAAILAGHVDALTAKLKPISQVPNKAGYLQLGIAPYAGAPNTTWWDRDLSVGGRVLVKEGDKIVTKLVKLDWPIARIPTLAPHFGAAAVGPFNPETQMVPIIGLEGTSAHASDFQNAEPFSQPSLLGGVNGPAGSFVSTRPPALVRAIGKALGLSVSTYANMINWELELFDVQPATVGGLDKEFIFAGRIDDKLCSWAAIQALIEAQSDTDNSSMIKTVGLFDDEEIGSLLRQGARGNFLPAVLERAVGSLADHHPTSDLMGRTYANSFLVSSDVIHAVNPNFLGAYLENHAPHLNVGVVVSADSNGHMTTDSVSTALFKRCADKAGAKLQVFQIRNDSRSGGTVGPMLSSMTGIRAIDAGIPQLSMHSIRATTGALDPGLGVLMFVGFLNGFEDVNKEFTE